MSTPTSRSTTRSTARSPNRGRSCRSSRCAADDRDGRLALRVPARQGRHGQKDAEQERELAAQHLAERRPLTPATCLPGFHRENNMALADHARRSAYTSTVPEVETRFCGAEEPRSIRGGRTQLPSPPSAPRGPQTMAPGEALGGRPLLARARSRGRGRGAARRANAGRDRADLRPLARERGRGGGRPNRLALSGARLRSGNRSARDGDHGFTPARAVLRLLDDRMGEPDRRRSRRPRARILARWAAGRPPAAARAPRLDRALERGVLLAVPSLRRRFHQDLTFEGLDDASAGAVVRASSRCCCSALRQSYSSGWCRRSRSVSP